MTNVVVDSEKYFREVYDRNVEMLYRVCYMYLKGNKSNIEDVVQNTFLQLLKKKKVFDSIEHEKAWLIRVSTNICKNMVTHWWNKKVPIEDMDVRDDSSDEQEILKLIFMLPDKYKQVIYLHYYEGYSGVEISNLLGIKENTIYSYLHIGREKLKEILKEELV
jgi:RNA polymerase sigma factor, sigma-70 family